MIECGRQLTNIGAFSRIFVSHPDIIPVFTSSNMLREIN